MKSRSLGERVPKPPRLNVLIGSASYQSYRMTVHYWIFDGSQWNVVCVLKQQEEFDGFPHLVPAIFVAAVIDAPDAINASIEMFAACVG